MVNTSKWRFNCGDEKGIKNQLYLNPLAVQKSQDTKLILAPRFILGVARVTQYDLLL